MEQTRWHSSRCMLLEPKVANDKPEQSFLALRLGLIVTLVDMYDLAQVVDRA